MADTKLQNLTTKSYSLVFGKGEGKGTSIIIRLLDNKSTKRYNFTEGYDTYKKLKKLYAQSRKLFDEECDKFDYGK
jgi:hypothetical protein